jgi:redox-sensitive bicupin YhaK (pirin superfamily)
MCSTSSAQVEHGDSVGNRDVIGPGDVQWMTAARGVVHEEFHSTEFSKRGGTFEMAQLWLNLPKDAKMTAPRYQAITKATIPQARAGPQQVEAPANPNKTEAAASPNKKRHPPASKPIRKSAGSYQN